MTTMMLYDDMRDMRSTVNAINCVVVCPVTPAEGRGAGLLADISSGDFLITSFKGLEI